MNTFHRCATFSVKPFYQVEVVLSQLFQVLRIPLHLPFRSGDVPPPKKNYLDLVFPLIIFFSSSISLTLPTPFPFDSPENW